MVLTPGVARAGCPWAAAPAGKEAIGAPNDNNR